MDNVRKNRVIRVAVQADFPPFSLQRNGSLAGYDVSVAKMLAHDLGVRLVLVPVSGPERIPALLDGRVDVIIASLGKNAEREKQIDFSTAYAPFFLGVFGSAADGVRDAAGLAGKKVGVTKGSIEEGELRKLNIAGLDLAAFDDNRATIAAFKSGEVKYIATGNVVISQNFSTDEAARIELKTLIKDSPCFIGMPKGDVRLADAIAVFLKHAKEYNGLQANSMQWFRQPYPKNLL